MKVPSMGSSGHCWGFPLSHICPASILHRLSVPKFSSNDKVIYICAYIYNFREHKPLQTKLQSEMQLSQQECRGSKLFGRAGMGDWELEHLKLYHHPQTINKHPQCEVPLLRVVFVSVCTP